MSLTRLLFACAVVSLAVILAACPSSQTPGGGNPPTAVDDAFVASVGLDLVGNVTTDNGGGADALGSPSATVTSFGAGSLGGAATDHPAGSTVTLAGGMLTLSSSGEMTLSGVTEPATFTFRYRLANASGSSEATVTIEVGGSVDAQDDLFTTSVGVDLIGDVTADNGSGADVLGAPPATVATFGGGDLGGTVADNAVGTSVPFAGGTLSLAADGSLALTDADVVGMHEFRYRLASATGSSEATVQIEVESAADVTGGAEAYAPGRTGEIRTAQIVLPGETTPSTVTYEVIDGLAIFEGDIILGEADTLANQSVVITGTDVRWPNNTVPYTIDSSLNTTMQARVQAAITHWNDNTNLTLVLRSNEQDYVEFRTGDGCGSAVGRKTDKQTIRLADGCSTGNAIHEIGHAIGLWHEQSREDRDSHVEVLIDNVIEDKRHNFDQHVSDGTDVGEYDHGSVMHYPATAFGKRDENGNRMTTIRTIPPGIAIGQRDGLSPQDIEAVNRLYPAQPVPYLEVAGPGMSSPDENSELVFTATVVDDIDVDLDDYTVTWSYDRWDGVPFFFDSTASGEATDPLRLCDGVYEVDVVANNASTGASATASIPFTVANADPKPDRCDWSIEIVEPQDGWTFVQGETVTLRAVIDDDHPETDDPLAPVVWRDGGSDGVIIQQPDILEFSRSKWGLGSHLIHVSYGHVSDAITFDVVEPTNQPPTATITSPTDGATLNYLNYQTDGSGMFLPVNGSGQDPEDGNLSGTSLSWSYRKAGTTTWVDAGQGSPKTIRIPLGLVSPRGDIEIRLVVTDSQGLQGYDIIKVTILGVQS